MEAAEIVETWRRRRNESHALTARLRRIRDVYNGDMVLPIEADTEPAVANMIMTGVDQTAGRIASVMPSVWFPPVRPGKVASETRADHRRDAIMGWWSDNRLNRQMPTRARYLVAYGQTPALLRPNFNTGCPEWVVRNPLATFPAEDYTDQLIPTDMITAFHKTWGWLRRNYPNVAYAEPANLTRDRDDSSQVVVLEYADSEVYRLIYAGVDTSYEPGMSWHTFENNTWGGFAIDMMPPLENKAHFPLATNVKRTVLDRIQGQFDQMIGMYSQQARLTALEIAAVERDIFPDVYLVGRPGEQPDFVHGPVDGRTGEVNIVKGGAVQVLNSPPGYQTTPMIDRLERAQRMTGGVPPEFGGESTTNIRTGRRGDAVLSAVIDYPILEAQEALADALEAENKIAIKISRGWFGDRAVPYHYTEKGRLKQGTYKPNEVFNESDHHEVTYPVAGADLNSLVVGIGQRIGLRTMSRQTAAELDPLIGDPELESDRITSESLEDAVLASIQQAAAAGAMPPEVVSRVAQLVREGEAELSDALAIATAEMQAAQQAPMGPTGLEAAVAAEAVAGQTGMPAAMPSVPEAGQGLQNLAGMMTALRKTNTRSAGRQALGGAY